MTSSTVDQSGGAPIAALHPEVLRTHVLTRLDGPTLASTACASSLFRALSADDELWRHICRATWPSVDSPRLRRLISSFPSGHRSFFYDSFPLLHHHNLDGAPPTDPRHSSSHPSQLISAVDIHYQDKLVLSRVVETDTGTGWFRCLPFRIDLLKQEERVPIPVKFGTGGDTCRSQLEENLIVSWIVVDPTRNRAANLSSRRPVSVQRLLWSGEVEVRYATAVGGGRKGSPAEWVELGVVVTCGGKEGGGAHMREVRVQVEDMEGRVLKGKDSMVILREAMEMGKRKLRGEIRERYEEFVEKRRERREGGERIERMWDMACMGFGFFFFVVLWWFVVFSFG
ncbi:F-box protein At2g27310-like [Malania oleifera]|uniref:F-box protein At2g27310-like n=1 Tax=Malania oleifera TaxID=397392 RepID=UPI0025ADDCBC|nr:F-box protein At2g27310-like [Malania oleifera]